MPRLPLLSSFRRSRREGGPSPLPPRVPRRAAPPPSHLRRERRALLELREERLRDLGGLMLEMARRDAFSESLLFEQCADVARIEDRLIEVELLLETRRRPAARCVCGAPLLSRSRFCANCGRPAGTQPAVSCSKCGHALAAETNFCPSCGTAAAGRVRAHERTPATPAAT